MNLRGDAFKCTVPEHWPELDTSDYVSAAGDAARWDITAVEEYGKTDKRLREQRPDLTQSERALHVAGIGTLRAGAQVASPILLGAAAGAAFGGPVGVVAGVAVGLALSIPMGDRTIGDIAGDIGEGILNLSKGPFEGLFG
ncbi:hypothetical protein [Arachnia propionica]|uniref:Uncharacterized protein n=1 Tax=Arachnia propionica TaxID=1750 RepID=A0A3P1WK20_9ACTN|nr:hypothetical protein [Arachnia propionica]RRD46565.1 hypothetical protein EII35_15490 [Arachnia propionica]